MLRGPPGVPLPAPPCKPSHAFLPGQYRLPGWESRFPQVALIPLSLCSRVTPPSKIVSGHTGLRARFTDSFLVT